MPFRDGIGHRKLVALLARSIARESLPPSLIFAGPSGVGKHLVAVATAQALNCLELARTVPPALDTSVRADATDACGRCPACDLRAKGCDGWVAAGRPELAS